MAAGAKAHIHLLAHRHLLSVVRVSMRWLCPGWSLLGSRLLHRPVRLRHRRPSQAEQCSRMRGKRHRLVHSIQLNGIVQEEEIGLVVGVPLHLLDQRLLPLAIDDAEDLLIELSELRQLADSIVRAVKGEKAVEQKRGKFSWSSADCMVISQVCCLAG